MKKFVVLILLAVFLVGIQGVAAWAIPAFRSEFENYYKCKEPETDAQKALAEKVAVAKCNVCHVDGEKKDVNNAYGGELGKLLDKANFSAARRKAEPEKVQQEIQEALKKVEAEEAPCGKTYGELIKAGELPCK
jgi:hypothetical protein